MRGLGAGREVARLAVTEEPLRLLEDWTRLRGDEDLVVAGRGEAVRLELDGRGPTTRLEVDREMVFRLVGAGLVRAGLVDFRTGAERGAALRVELGRLRRVVLVDDLDGVVRGMEEDRPGIALGRLVAGAAERLLLAGAGRAGIRRVVIDDPRLVAAAGCLLVPALDGVVRGMEEDRPGVALGRLVAGAAERLLLAGAVRAGIRLGI